MTTKKTAKRPATRQAKPRKRKTSKKTAATIALAPGARQAKEPGVIATIVNMISRKGGMTKADMLAELVKRFPKRAETALGRTLGCQMSRQDATKDPATGKWSRS